MATSSFSATKIATYGSMVFVQIITSTYVVMSKVILIQGTSSTVFLVYQFMLATIVMGALALILERKNRPPLKIPILCWIFLLALVGITLTQNLLSACLYYISSTIEAAVLNMIPVFTYIISIISREEKLEINTLWGKGKVFGTLVSVTGALTLILWHGSAVVLLTSNLGEWVLGLAMVVAGVLAFSTWIILLRPISMRYPAELSMTALMFFFATLQTMVVAAITSHKASKWSLKWDLELLNIVFGHCWIDHGSCGALHIPMVQSQRRSLPFNGRR
ncbi:WAT1-related protein At3g18200-like isoform X2 [Magnolia sinica]|uniref:WAT1-related protein At3g18200-like isoform X2 n=1 Tax=Magnolia sinica TaxID=86752 RepID=UPI002658564B|nr:WAT1-related protein At3g18200-like isoform X2 [Magnolia sinica]